MAQSLNIKIAGLYSYPSDLSAVPPGALSDATNIVLDQDSIAAPRRGNDYLSHAGVQSQFSDPSYRANKLFYYQNQILSHYSTSSMAYHDSSLGWVPYTGTFTPPAVTVKVRSAQANQNFYFTTASGVQKLDRYNGTPSAIGVPPGIDLQSSLTTTFNQTVTTASGSATLTAIGSTANLAIGMSVTGTGVPANTLILSFTASTAVMSQQATASGTISATFAPPATWLPVSYSTGYRMLWGIKDANQNLILGAPSSISNITNSTGSTAAVNLNFSIPAGITTAHFYQIYRSAAVPAPSTPNDEGQLVYQGNPLASDLSAGFIVVNDIVPDALRGATIYTAQSQEGLANQNYVPPLAYDLAVFRNCLFFGNTMGLQNYSLSLLAVGAPSGIQVGDTLTIGGVVYTASAAENIAAGQFLVTPAFLLVTTGNTNTSTALTGLASTTGVTVGMGVSGIGIPAGTFVAGLVSGTAVTLNQAATATATGVAITFTGDSAAQAIRDTALSLVKVINRYASSTVYAYYTSISTGLPGQMTFNNRSVGGSQFAVTSSRSTSWNPALPSSGTTQQSKNDTNKNYVYYSKQNQPEAVPIGNFFPVGSADKNILRIIPLRDSLFIIKEDGTFTLTGTDPSNFIVRPLDYTSILIAPETAVALNNQIYCLTTQGVVAISEIGAPIMSHPIEGNLTSLTSANYQLLQNSSFGVAYESSRAYYLFCISSAADSGPTQYYRFNYITNSWTHGTLAKTCGAVNPLDDKMYLGNSTKNIVDVERKALNYSDYADYQSTETISAVVGKVISISSSDTILPGSIIFQSANVFGTVVSTDPVAGTATLTLASSLVPGAADVLAPIATSMAWVPVTLENPGFTKQLREATLLFLADFNGTGQVGFSSDVSQGVLTEVVPGGSVGGWGLFAWGGTQDITPSGTINVLGAPWGGDPRRRPVRVSITRNHQRSSILTVSWQHAYAYSPWKLQGLSLIGNLVSERVSN